MATRPAYVWTGSDFDDIGDKRLGPSVTALESELASKLDLAGGKILQIVRATDSTGRSTTSTSFVDASISVTITPQKSDSAIVLLWAFMFDHQGTADAGGFQITDSSNNPVSGAENLVAGSSTTVGFFSHTSLFGYATPATTSATTYKGRFRVFASGTTVLTNTLVTGQLYAIEVSA